MKRFRVIAIYAVPSVIADQDWSAVEQYVLEHQPGDLENIEEIPPTTEA